MTSAKIKGANPFLLVCTLTGGGAKTVFSAKIRGRRAELKLMTAQKPEKITKNGRDKLKFKGAKI